MNVELRIFLVLVLFALTSCNPYQVAQIATSTVEPTATPYYSPTAQPSATPQACTVATGYEIGALNLRTGPGISYAVIRVLAEGETLEVIARGVWHEVTDTQGNHGFINSNYCTIGE